MAAHNCDTCGFRARYDRNPKSFLGRLWRWHASWCPGFSAYMRSLPEEKRHQIAKAYRLEKIIRSADAPPEEEK